MDETTKCPFCSEEILKAARKCKHCGEFLEKDAQPRPQYVMKKSSGLAAVLSFFWVGLGQIYNGQFLKGFAFGFIYLFLWIWAWIAGLGSMMAGGQMLQKQPHGTGGAILLSTFVTAFATGGLPLISFWIFGMRDAHKTAERINKGEVQAG